MMAAQVADAALLSCQRLAYSGNDKVPLPLSPFSPSNSMAARDLIKEITQIGDFLRAQKEILPEEVWTHMSMNHVSAVEARILALTSMTPEEATVMVESIRVAHYAADAKSRFCEAVSSRLSQLQASPKKARKENQTCAGFYNYLSKQDRDILADAAASQTTKLTQVVSRCCKIGLMWPAEQTVGRVMCTAVAAGLSTVDTEATFLNAVQEYKRILRKQRDKTPLPQFILNYGDDPSSLPDTMRVSYQADPVSPIQVADVMAIESMVALRNHLLSLRVWSVSPFSSLPLSLSLSLSLSLCTENGWYFPDCRNIS